MKRQPDELVSKDAQGLTSLLELSHDVIICVSLIQYQYLIFEYHNYRDIETVIILPINFTDDLMVY